ncbi:efflux transporter periplasmic adaptor subunit, partial [Corallococcus coralloides]|nr:efflux transporter periplasmic adaptor subunit [Corallococcus coralloides]
MNSIKSSISKKHLIAIAVVIAMGVGAGALILQGGKTKAAAGEGDGHGHGTHTEAKGHGDGEHHGKADGKGHDDDKGHADGEHHEKSESKGANGGSLFKEGDFGLEALLAEDGGEPRLRIWMFDKDKSLPQSAATVAATVTRPTGEKQTLSFIQEKDGWVSRENV